MPEESAERRESVAVVEEILQERLRQVREEGWTEKHDDLHTDGSLAMAASAYAFASTVPGQMYQQARLIPSHMWPRSWNESWYKPTNPRRDLVKAAALIVAEIERLDRAERPRYAKSEDRGGERPAGEESA